MEIKSLHSRSFQTLKLSIHHWHTPSMHSKCKKCRSNMVIHRRIKNPSNHLNMHKYIFWIQIVVRFVTGCREITGSYGPEKAVGSYHSCHTNAGPYREHVIWRAKGISLNFLSDPIKWSIKYTAMCR